MHRLLALAFIATIGFANAAAASGLAGTWIGTWTKNGDALAVTVSFVQTDKGFAGSFDCDALQAAAIPFKDVRLTGNKAHWVLAGDTTTNVFDGTLSDRTLAGAFKEGDVEGTFQLQRAKTSTSVIQTRDVSFKNSDAVLAGTVLFPASKGTHPAIIFLHGAGDEGRWANRYLAQRFAQAGFAALIFDKRGVGQSTGDWHKGGFEELAGDAVAGIRILQSLPQVDAKKVGAYGHSQGGTLVPLVAQRAGDLAFVIGSAAGGIDPAEMEEYSVGNSLDVSKMTPQEAAEAKAFVHAIVNVGYRGKPRAELDKIAAKFKARSWYFAPPPPDNFYWAFAKRISSYDPAVYWRQVEAPVLLLFGEKDERVPPKESSAAIIFALRAGGNNAVTLKLFPEADHTFQLPSPNGGWPKRVADYADVMIEWAKKQTK